MVSIALRISDEFKAMIDKLPWVNWSELAREEAIKQEKRAVLFKELEELTKDSTLTDKDCLRLGKLVNKRIVEKLQKKD